MVSSEPHYDVGIVGFGPVGATLANLLGALGCSVAVFEREAKPVMLPRAVHFDDEVMRVFQTIGVADAIAPDLFVNIGMRFVDAAGRAIIDWPRPQERSVQGWYPSYRFHQPDLEAALRRGVARYGQVQVRLGADITVVSDDGDCAVIGFEDRANGERGNARCRYLVGCDGARSSVRRAMATPLEDLGSHDSWLVVDLILDKLASHLSDFTIQLCDPARPTTMARGVGRRRRWEFKIMPGDDPQVLMRPETIQAMVAPWVEIGPHEIERVAIYTFHAVLATGWRRGRLLLAGDSAHQTPPFLGQGLCAGIRDAANLAWKLAAVVKGEAGIDLLDSYEAERSSHVRSYIDLAVRLGEVLQTTDREAAASRDREMVTNPHYMRSISPSLGSGLHGSDPAPCGTLGWQPRLSDGRLLDDVVGLGPALLIRAGLAAQIDAGEIADWRASGLSVLVGEGAAYLAHLNTGAVLLRPDRYVLGLADEPLVLRSIIARLPLRRVSAQQCMKRSA